MQIHWTIADDELKAVRALFTTMEENVFVVQRLHDNVTGSPPTFQREEFWRVMLGCLLTTQQGSGPDSPVTRFLRCKPFRASLQNCSTTGAEILLKAELSSFGGIRRGNTIARHAQANLTWLDSGGWKVMEDAFERLREQRVSAPSWAHVAVERSVAEAVDEKLLGFGPKQSRNFWQWLGMTRYEIPLDSRIMKWLTKNTRLPVKISAASLADQGCYDLVMSAVHALCAAADVLPCMLDAAVFASYDREWLPDELEY